VINKKTGLELSYILEYGSHYTQLNNTRHLHRTPHIYVSPRFNLGKHLGNFSTLILLKKFGEYRKLKILMKNFTLNKFIWRLVVKNNTTGLAWVIFENSFLLIKFHYFNSLFLKKNSLFLINKWTWLNVVIPLIFLGTKIRKLISARAKSANRFAFHVFLKMAIMYALIHILIREISQKSEMKLILFHY
jgi:hypothetical protein